jgi:hypothetical protein
LEFSIKCIKTGIGKELKMQVIAVNSNSDSQQSETSFKALVIQDMRKFEDAAKYPVLLGLKPQDFFKGIDGGRKFGIINLSTGSEAEHNINKKFFCWKGISITSDKANEFKKEYDKQFVKWG